MLQERTSEVVVVGVGTSLANSEAFSFANSSNGLILVPSTEATPSLEFYTSETEGGTFRKVYAHDSATALSVTVAASIAKQIPPQLFAARWVKIVASAISSGTAIKYTILLKA
jgi:hypothetical protein